MTIANKKQQFKILASEFLITRDISRLNALSKDIVGEVISCNFSESMLAIINIIVPMWDKNLASYIRAIDSNESNAEVKKSTEISLLGLYYLLDVSQFTD